MREWLRRLPVADPMQRPFAELLQLLLISLLVLLIPGLGANLLTMPERSMVVATALVGSVVASATIGALVLLRRGRVGTAFTIFASTLIIAFLQGLSSQGIGAGAHFLLLLLAPLILSTLLGSRALTLTLTGVTLAAIGATYLLELVGSPLVGWQPPSANPGATALSNFVISLVLLLPFLARFSSALRRALASAWAREQELEMLREDLERTVHERTANLQATVDQLKASQATIRELGAPVLPVLPGVLVAPLIGAIDSARAEALGEGVLAAVERHRASHLIFDITGVSVVDTQVAQALLRTAEAVRLLGARPALAGVRAEVAQTIVGLGLSMGGLATYPNLQEAVLELTSGEG